MCVYGFKVITLVLYKITLERDNDLFQLLLCSLGLLKYHEVDKKGASDRIPCCS